MSDMMATFAELTEIKLEGAQGPDSISFANLLRDPKGEGTRKDLIMDSVVQFVIRDGDWKLCLCPGSGVPPNSPNAAGNEPVPTVAWEKALEQFEGELTDSDLLNAPFVQLFDLSKDLHEDTNLAAEYPKQVQKMVALLQSQIENGRSTPGPKLSNDKNVKIVNVEDKRLPNLVRQK